MESWIPLDRHQPARLLDQAFGQDAGAGSDLHHQVFRANLCRSED
jgi:hypothetical protein